MRVRLSAGPAVLRAAGLGALLLLLINPTRSRPASSTPPLVLLDASLSMGRTNVSWRAALDSARRLAAGGLIWRFGDRLAAFDTSDAADGATQLAPALDAAAARGGPIVVVTDGVVSDVAALAPDLRRRPRIVVLPRAPFYDVFLDAVDAPRHVSARDTLHLRVTYGSAGSPPPGTAAPRLATLAISNGGRPLETRPVPLPAAGTMTAELALPAARLQAGWSALDVRVSAAGDAENRDDARRIAVDVSRQPTAVVLAAPSGWEARFFARTLRAVAGVPVRLFDETEPGRWRDGATLAAVSSDAVRQDAGQARLVALIGDSRALDAFAGRSGVIVWTLDGGRAGDWYVEPPPASPLAGALGGITWDSLPPLIALRDLAADSAGTTLLTARLARRGTSRPLIVLHDADGDRRVTVAGAGLWRWIFRGGAPAEGYRSLVAGLTDWLLSGAGTGGDRVEPVATEVANGLPLQWRWVAHGAPRNVPIVLEGVHNRRTDTLRFDPSGGAQLRLPPDAYRWRLADGGERGLVIVEEYSAEWRPAAATLNAQPGSQGSGRVETNARDQWWWYWIAIAAFAGEWAWRRHRGLA
jgi:hypothetical protein